MCPFKKGEGREPLNLLESQVRYAMENTKSNLEASRFLNISYPTYKKYAKLYKDNGSDNSLFDLHKNQAGKGTKKAYNVKKGKYALVDILDGKYPNYPISNLKNRIIRNLVFEEKCNSCGFDERRVTDFTIPLLLDHTDGDRTNHKKENLQLLCYNCYYNSSKNPFGKSKKQW
jgi:hypothetical protein